MIRFTAREYFEAEPESRENVQVSFNEPPSVAAPRARPGGPRRPGRAGAPAAGRSPADPGTPPTA